MEPGAGRRRRAGVDRVEVLVRAAEAASHSGEFRQAVGLAREATVDEDAEPLRAATATSA